MTAAIWVPAWFELDQSVVVNDRDIFFFEMSANPLRFSNFAGDVPIFEAEATVVGILHEVLGELRAILAENLDYELIKPDGSRIRIDAEQDPGRVYDTGETLEPLQFTIELSDVSPLPPGDKRALSGCSPEKLKRLHAQRKLRWAKLLDAPDLISPRERE